MKLLTLITLALTANLAYASKNVVVGKDWVVTVPNGNAMLEIHQYFPDDQSIEVLVNCTFPDGQVTAKTRASAQITDSQIINRQAATDKVYSPSGRYWCMAVVANRTLNYAVLADDQISITGDPFIPDGSVLQGQLPK